MFTVQRIGREKAVLEQQILYGEDETTLKKLDQEMRKATKAVVVEVYRNATQQALQ